MSLPPKYIPGMLALCPFCGMSAANFNTCTRCRRKLPENVKTVPVTLQDKPIPVAAADASPAIKVLKKWESNRETDFKFTFKNVRENKKQNSVTAQCHEAELLSPEEENENNKQNKSLPILDKEPVISATTISSLKSKRLKQEASGEYNNSISDTEQYVTLVQCRTVRIGSYKFVPNAAIELTSNGFSLDVPSLNDGQTIVTINVKYEDIIVTLMHFNQTMPVIFFYIDAPTASRIRTIIGMTELKGPYFDPTSEDQSHKRIIFLPEILPIQCKLLLKKIFHKILLELNSKEANNILVKASLKAAAYEKYQATIQGESKKTTFSNTSAKVEIQSKNTVDHLLSSKSNPFDKNPELKQSINHESVASKANRNRVPYSSTQTTSAEKTKVADEVKKPEQLQQQLNSNSNLNKSTLEIYEKPFYTQHRIEDPSTAIVLQQIVGNEAKMLVIMNNGEQRLIVFDVLNEDCTVKHLLDNAGIDTSEKPRVSLVLHPALAINYIIYVTSAPTCEETEQMENYSHCYPFSTETAPVKELEYSLVAAVSAKEKPAAAPVVKSTCQVTNKRERGGGRVTAVIQHAGRQTNQPECLTLLSSSDEECEMVYNKRKRKLCQPNSID